MTRVVHLKSTYVMGSDWNCYVLQEGLGDIEAGKDTLLGVEGARIRCMCVFFIYSLVKLSS